MKGGRPLLGEERRERYQIVLEPRIAESIKAIGGGSLTAGINALYAQRISKQAVAARKRKAQEKRR